MDDDVWKNAGLLYGLLLKKLVNGRLDMMTTPDRPIVNYIWTVRVKGESYGAEVSIHPSDLCDESTIAPFADRWASKLLREFNAAVQRTSS